ncbi:hypothetical protein WN48_05289 [Eufriesea mexicana]|uniref:Uncharacterized protein n=1 Tax=Eufriesea mexicana TaxID=516756 RepID=A0A310SG16_9HYME|nr:hypothetical protein WN48_05289 [Eufriesea mexicana]
MDAETCDNPSIIFHLSFYLFRTSLLSSSHLFQLIHVRSSTPPLPLPPPLPFLTSHQSSLHQSSLRADQLSTNVCAYIHKQVYIITYEHLSYASSCVEQLRDENCLQTVRNSRVR